jgi:predicted Zn finger-like uncharacterized protein
MPEIVNCPQCARQLRVPDELLGKKVKCPTCGTNFNAELAEPSPAPSPEPRRPLGPPPGVRRPREDEDVYEDDPGEAALGRPRRQRRDARPHRGPLILGLGILSIVCLFQFLGPIAWVMGHHDLAEMRSGRMDREGEGLTNAGRICGIVGTVLLVPCLCFGILALIGALAGDN